MMGDGIHLMVDGLARQSPTKWMVQRFLEDVPGAIGMTPIMPLSILRNGGDWVGVQVIAESHIAVHTKGKQVHCDIFSCKPFVLAIGISLVVGYLGLVEFRSQSIRRTWRPEAVPA